MQSSSPFTPIPCQTYQAVTNRRNLLRMPDGRSAFKIYFTSIIGRDKPDSYEWPSCPLTFDQFEENLKCSGLLGVGFVTAFPHIAKVFRFSPANETILNVRAFKSPDFSDLGLARDNGFVEFACLAEALIGADEYMAWANSKSVEAYLQFWSTHSDMPVVRNTKLAEYWA